MTSFLAIALAASFASAGAPAEPEYVAIRMEIDVNKSAADTWAKVGGYCDIAQWLSSPTRAVTCAITSGDGGIGTVRAINTTIIEILVARTDLSYGYTQPAKEGQFYNLYHGFVEAKPVTATTSKIIYTLVLDVSNLADKAAKDADVARRRRTFEGALANMKRIAEAP
jgi:hypothetical protein